MEMVSTKPQLRVLLDHLGTIKDTRQPWKVAYPLREVLFLVVCGTIACGDDYDDIVDGVRLICRSCASALTKTNPLSLKKAAPRPSGMLTNLNHRALTARTMLAFALSSRM